MSFFLTNTFERCLAQNMLVEIHPVVLQKATPQATTIGAPPQSDTMLVAGSEFVVELWAQQTNTLSGGLTCVFSDLLFDPSALTCSGTKAEAEFAFFSSGVCDDATGTVDELGGCSISFPGPGIAPTWARVAIVTLTSTGTADELSVVSAPANLDVSIAAYGNVPPDQIRFSATAPLDIVLHQGDIDGDYVVDHTDLAIFIDCMAGPHVEQSPLECMNQWPGSTDMDGDLDVDLKDFVLLEAAVGRFAAAAGP